MTTPDIHEVKCHIQRSVRYHRARARFFASWSNWFSFISLISGTSVVVTLLAEAPEWVALCAGAVVALAQALEQALRLSTSAREHSGFATEFIALERALELKGDVTDSDLREIQGNILSIEMREPPIKRYLDLMCHNQVARSIGSTDTENLTFIQRAFAQYLNGDSVGGSIYGKNP